MTLIITPFDTHDINLKMARIDEQTFINSLSKDITHHLTLPQHTTLWTYHVPREYNLEKVFRFVTDFLLLSLETPISPAKLIGHRIISIDFTNFFPDVTSIVEYAFKEIIRDISLNAVIAIDNFTFSVPDHINRDTCCIDLDEKLNDAGIRCTVMGKDNQMLVSVSKRSGTLLTDEEKVEDDPSSDLEQEVKHITHDLHEMVDGFTDPVVSGDVHEEEEEEVEEELQICDYCGKQYEHVTRTGQQLYACFDCFMKKQ